MTITGERSEANLESSRNGFLALEMYDTGNDAPDRHHLFRFRHAAVEAFSLGLR